MHGDAAHRPLEVATYDGPTVDGKFIRFGYRRETLGGGEFGDGPKILGGGFQARVSRSGLDGNNDSRVHGFARGLRRPLKYGQQNILLLVIGCRLAHFRGAIDPTNRDRVAESDARVVIGTIHHLPRLDSGGRRGSRCRRTRLLT